MFNLRFGSSHVSILNCIYKIIRRKVKFNVKMNGPQPFKSHSWSAVKLDLYGLKFFTLHVLRKPWVMPHLIKPPKAARLPDIVTVAEAQALFAATRTLTLAGVLFCAVQRGPSPERGLGPEGQRYRWRARPGAHPRLQRRP